MPPRCAWSIKYSTRFADGTSMKSPPKAISVLGAPVVVRLLAPNVLDVLCVPTCVMSEDYAQSESRAASNWLKKRSPDSPPQRLLEARRSATAYRSMLYPCVVAQGASSFAVPFLYAARAPCL